MKSSFFTNERQLSEWIEAAEGIKDSFGINKALGYLIGEKFYNIIHLVYSYRKTINFIDELRKKPDLNPIQEYEEVGSKGVANLDEDYTRQFKNIEVAREALDEFSGLIKKSFTAYEIKQYLNSNPRFGPFGHTVSEKEHKLLVEKGAVEHSLETEVEDAFIYGEMRHYLL